MLDKYPYTDKKEWEGACKTLNLRFDTAYELDMFEVFEGEGFEF